MNEPIDDFLDIINLPHYRSATRQPMSMSARAAQFAPFAALTGHEEMLAETARHTSQAIELSPEEAAALSRRIQRIMSTRPAPTVAIRHFCPDHNKDGGMYVVTTGVIHHIESDINQLILTDKTAIPMQSIIAIRTLSRKQQKSV